MSEKITQVLGGIVERFKNGDIPQAVALSMFPIPNVPAAKWSLLNRTLMFFSGTHDARGFKQWNAAGRRIKKGARAVHILAPRLKKIVDKETEEKKVFLNGFLTIPVFRVEDTEGEPLDYEAIEVPDFPLLDIAREWGISVKAVPGNYRYYGYFQPEQNEIALASPEECIFFHELAHSAHHKITPLKPGQDWKQEIVAELSAAALCRSGRQSLEPWQALSVHRCLCPKSPKRSRSGLSGSLWGRRKGPELNFKGGSLWSRSK